MRNLTLKINFQIKKNWNKNSEILRENFNNTYKNGTGKNICHYLPYLGVIYN